MAARLPSTRRSLSRPSVNEQLRDQGLLLAIEFRSREEENLALTLDFLDSSVRKAVERRLRDRLPVIVDATSRRLRPGAVSEVGRIKQLQQNLDGIISAGFAEVSARAGESAADIAQVEAAAHYASLRGILPLEVRLRQVPVEVIRGLAAGEPFQGKHLRDWFGNLAEATQLRVREELAAGVALGLGVDDIVRGLLGVRGQGFTGDAALGGALRRHTRTIVRTAFTSAATAARDKVYAANADVIAGVQYVATLDGRTTDICMGLDGKVFGIGEGPRPPSHMNCRSTVVPVVKGWQQLGLDGAKLPTGTRASMDGQVAANTNFGDWIAGQPRGIQDLVLGTERAELYRSGSAAWPQLFDPATGRFRSVEGLRRHLGINPPPPPPTPPPVLPTPTPTPPAPAPPPAPAAVAVLDGPATRARLVDAVSRLTAATEARTAAGQIRHQVATRLDDSEHVIRNMSAEIVSGAAPALPAKVLQVNAWVRFGVDTPIEGQVFRNLGGLVVNFAESVAASRQGIIFSTFSNDAASLTRYAFVGDKAVVAATGAAAPASALGSLQLRAASNGGFRNMVEAALAELKATNPALYEKVLERVALLEEGLNASVAYNKSADSIADGIAAIRNEIAATGNGSRLNISHDIAGIANAGIRETYEDALQWLREVGDKTSGPSLKVTAEIRDSTSRASASLRNGEAIVKLSSRVVGSADYDYYGGSLVHEVGHHIEASVQANIDQSARFFSRRQAYHRGDAGLPVVPPVQLSKYYGYKAHADGDLPVIEDSFFPWLTRDSSLYTGKVYPVGAMSGAKDHLTGLPIKTPIARMSPIRTSGDSVFVPRSSAGRYADNDRPYGISATELISMTLEHLYKTPHLLITQRPELFDLGIAVMRGLPWDGELLADALVRRSMLDGLKPHGQP